jgi:hypothetical protein
LFYKTGGINMGKSNIFDFITHKSFEEITTKDYKTNDELVGKHGLYVGCLKKSDSDKLRTLGSQLEFKRQQINQLNREWEELSFKHQEILNYCINFLSKECGVINKTKIEDVDIFVDEGGHAWAVEKSKVK